MSGLVDFTRRRLLKLPFAAAIAGSGTAVAAATGVHHVSLELGGSFQGERLARMMAEKNYRDGAFHNLPGGTRGPAVAESRWKKITKAFAEKPEGVKPSAPVAHQKTDLSSVRNGEMLWLGHSAFYLRAEGLSIAVDPALAAACPIPGFFEPFKGADVYRAEDIPPLDVLLITHDHYDHLDYPTIAAIRSRVKRVVCPLGVGAHFEAWGYDPERITETVWYESVRLAPNLELTCLPSQHFSGRTMTMNTTLWAGFIFDIAGYKLYLSGDGGYGPHFKAVRDMFGRIDFAVLEDGQYNKEWSDIHLMPADWKLALTDIAPAVVMPCHNAKYALSRHVWTDPLTAALDNARSVRIPVTTPLIGSRIALADPAAAGKIWWPEKP